MTQNKKIIRKLHNQKGKVFAIETNLTGRDLLKNPMLNKDIAFSQEERIVLGLTGFLPEKVESIEEQAIRVKSQLANKDSDIGKYIFLQRLHDMNCTLFYYYVRHNIKEAMPIIYTPTVGEAVEKFSNTFRKQRGLFLSINHKNQLNELLEHYDMGGVDLVLVTDGEAVLGIGDQGIGGMNISIAKAMVYVACSGLNPKRILPIQLDVGTNNDNLLNDSGYLGLKLPRFSGEAYDEFIDSFVSAIKNRFPNACIHWEDFGQCNASRILEKYKQKICTFNDDIQGTGIVVYSAIYSRILALGLKPNELKKEKFIIYGAGTAGCGIANQITDIIHDKTGQSIEDCQKQIYLFDRSGLITRNTKARKITNSQKPYIKDIKEIAKWTNVKDKKNITLTETISNIKASVLIGTSGSPGAFTQDVVVEMSKANTHPLIFPLSNPTNLCEVIPENMVKWSKGKVMMATGSPFDNVEYDGRTYIVSQGNNAFIFPGLGLGTIAVKSKLITPAMIRAACYALSKNSPAVICENENLIEPLLPNIEDSIKVSKHVAFAVAKQSVLENNHNINIASDLDEDELDAEINRHINLSSWTPVYAPYMEV